MILFLLIALTSCGSENDTTKTTEKKKTTTTAKNQAPKLSNLEIHPEEIFVGDGGGSVEVNLTFDFSDADKNFNKVTLLDKDTDEIVQIPFDEAMGSGSDTLIIFFNLDTSEPLIGNLELYGEDSKGAKSNRIPFTIEIKPN